MIIIGIFIFIFILCVILQIRLIIKHKILINKINKYKINKCSNKKLLFDFEKYPKFFKHNFLDLYLGKIKHLK